MKCPMCGAAGPKSEKRKHEVKYVRADGGVKTRTVEVYGIWCDYCNDGILDGVEALKIEAAWKKMEEEEDG